MRLTKAQRDANHERIIEVAGRLFRKKGIDGVGIDEIMAEAGLTHGGFYGHFASKTALVAEAGIRALASGNLKRLEEGAPPGGRTGFPLMVERYLSTRHRDNPGVGCAVAALAADIGRQDEAVRARFAEALETAIDDLARRLPGDPAEARREAIFDYAALVGTLVMARSAGTGALSDELLATVRERLATA